MNSENDLFYEEMKMLDEDMKTKQKGFYKRHFNVYTLEASSGKTRQLVKSAIETKRQMLIVTKFMSEVALLVNDINKGANGNKAVGIVSDLELIKDNNNLVSNSKQIEFFTYDIIVITHSQYYKLCKGENKYLEFLVDDFDTVVIDEEFNPIKNNLYTFSVGKNSEMFNIFSSFGMQEELKDLTKCLENEIYNKGKYSPNNQLHWVEVIEDKVFIDLKCTTIINLINENSENINIKLYDYNNVNNTTYDIYDLIDYIKLIKKIILNSIEGYGLISVYFKTITTYDYDFEYFMLNKNIMLDASGNFSTIYDSEMFEVVKSERKIDHSNCKVNVVKIPTTTSSKDKIAHLFRPKFTSYVIKCLGENGKGLIVTKKDEANYLQNINFKDFDKEYTDRVSFCNYENQRGRNDYADYNHVFLAHTYRQPPQYYIFLYRYFFGIKATSKEIETINKKDKYGDKRWTFYNCKILEWLMFTDMVSSQYQSLKRVARNRNPKATYRFLTNDYKVTLEVLKQLNGIELEKSLTVIEEIEFLGERVTKRSKEDTLRDYINDKLSQGKWEAVKSSELQKKLNISRPKWNEIWKDEEFINFAKEKRIKQGRKKGMKVDHVYKY